MSVGDNISWSDIVHTQHFTQPPPRFSDASLIKKLESDGVGRPSTYASIIDTLLNRKYMDRKNKSFECTETGIMVSDYLCEHFSNIVDTGFTASMESGLDEISDGKHDVSSFLRTFFDSVSSDVDSAMKSGFPKSFESDIKCGKCSSGMIKKISSHGPFLGCSGWPECSEVRPIGPDGKIPEVVETGLKCPDCSGILVKRGGKNGDFYGCKAYPTCKFTAGVGEEGEMILRKKSVAKDTGHKCPKCKKGTMLERAGRYGKFYGCSSYPKCKNILKSVPSK
jgi:DNA topoisomerase-1